MAWFCSLTWRLLRSDFVVAFCLSVLATCWFCLALSPWLLLRDPNQEQYSITDCCLFDSGRMAAITYASLDRPTLAPAREFVLMVDLTGPIKVINQAERRHYLVVASPHPWQQIVTLDERGNVRLLDKHHLSGHDELLTFRPMVPTDLQCIDARRIAVLIQNRLQVWDIVDNEPLWYEAALSVARFEVVPGRASLIATYIDGRLEELDARTGRRLHSIEKGSGPALALAVSGNGRRLAVLDESEGASVFELQPEPAGWSPVAAHIPALGTVLAISPNGQYIASVPDPSRKDLAIWNIATRRYVERFTGREGQCRGAVFCNDHRLIAWHDGGLFHRWDWRRGNVETWLPGRLRVPGLRGDLVLP